VSALPSAVAPPFVEVQFPGAVSLLLAMNQTMTFVNSSVEFDPTDELMIVVPVDASQSRTCILLSDVCNEEHWEEINLRGPGLCLDTQQTEECASELTVNVKSDQPLRFSCAPESNGVLNVSSTAHTGCEMLSAFMSSCCLPLCRLGHLNSLGFA
jgi:hypothetical protein